MKVKCLTTCRWGGLNGPRYQCKQGEIIEIDESLKAQAIASGMFEIVIEKAKKVQADDKQ